MFYLDTADQMSFLVTVCCSFCIFIFTTWFRNADTHPRLLGYAFFTPFLLTAASMLVQKEAAASSLSLLSEPALLLLIFIVSISQPSKKRNGRSIFILFATPVVLLLLDSFWVAFQNYLSDPLNSLPVFVVLLILNLYLLKKEDGSKSLVFWAMLPLALGTAAESFLNTGWGAYAIPVLKLSAYILFISYFNSVYIGHLTTKVAEAEKRISVVNRSLDYEVKKRVLEIERVNQSLLNVSKTDALSKTLNKAAILDAIGSTIMSKPKNEFSILMFDIDNFKSINDTLGHVAGDKCIKALSVTAKNNLRDFDLIGRYGGDEFVIVLPGTTAQQALQIAERFRKTIDGSESPHYTISIGIASYPKDGITTKELVEAADEGLYRSKAKGKNAVSHRQNY